MARQNSIRNASAGEQALGKDALRLSPKMAELRMEYLARCERNSREYDKLEALADDAPNRNAVAKVREAALGALRDIEYQILATPIRTLADALLVIRLRVKLEGECMHLPAFREPDEAALINALRVLNAVMADDTSINDDPKDADAWLSQPPYHEEGAAAVAA